MKLSKEFYKKLDEIVTKRVVNEENISIFKNINWEKEADRCLSSLKDFFGGLGFKKFKDNKVGVVDIRWNEYGGDIEIDFMPENNFDTAFNDGCIDPSSAIDNDKFFKEYFDCTGEKSFEKIDDDYFNLTFVFYYMFFEIIPYLIKDKSFVDLPKKEPYYISFACTHDDEEPGVIFTNQEAKSEKKILIKSILKSFKAYADKNCFNLELEPISKVIFIGMADTGFEFGSMVSKENGDDIFSTCDDFSLDTFFKDGSSKNMEKNFDRACDILVESLKEAAKTKEFQLIPKVGAITFELNLLDVKEKVLCIINPDGTIA